MDPVVRRGAELLLRGMQDLTAAMDTSPLERDIESSRQERHARAEREAQPAEGPAGASGEEGRGGVGGTGPPAPPTEAD